MPEIGSTLREARMRARIDISEIEAQTKIRAKYLRALENEEWGLLPGPTFVKSFLRTYATALGLDGRALVEEYRLTEEPQSEVTHEQIMPSQRLADRREGSSNAYRFAVGAVVALIVVLVILLASKHGKDATPPAAAKTHIRLFVRADGPVHVCLLDAEGNRVMHYTRLQAGQRSRAYRSTSFLLWSSGRQAKVVVGRRVRALPEGSGPVGVQIGPTGDSPAASNARQQACG
ncbi:MAG TPA: helix-turn-helix domain-containing protein [Solirubrobacteraceae bacterium]|nr:helix-turn-helix domain-containing protein [Solirubrobacteraceae bacterium]